jgi:hypothetical protein
MPELHSTTHRLADFAEVQDHFHANGWTDGLPVVPPTPEAVTGFLRAALLSPGHLVGVEPVRGRAVTAEKAAVNAVMAGCRPEHFPVVVTALTAMLAEPFQLHGPTASTGGSAVLLVVNGPVRDEIGLSAGFSVLGGGDRAATCIGRAIRLCLINLFDVRPGGIDRSTLGHPGKLSFCLAEDETGDFADGPAPGWPSLGDERLGLAGGPEAGLVSSVTAVAAMAPRQIMNEWTTAPEEILETFAAEIRANMANYSIWSGNYVVVVTPQLRAHLVAAGWSKADVRAHLFERARILRRAWADVGKGSVVGDKGDREYRALERPDDLLVVAAGGPAGGFGAVIPPWLGTRSHAVTVPVGACVDC